jgi:hypothetical protein
VEDHTILKQVDSEARKATVVLLATDAAAPAPYLLFNAGRFSTLSTVLRYKALIQREWGNWVRYTKYQPLTASDIKMAREFWFRY